MNPTTPNMGRRRWLATIALGGTLLTAAGVGITYTAVGNTESPPASTSADLPSPYGQLRSGGSATDGLDVTAATDEQQEGTVVIETLHGYANAGSAGTGIVLTSDGLVLTNNHVIEGSTEIRVTVPSTGETYAATVVGTDATSDIAVIELENASGLTTAELDDDNDPAVGDDVTGVGNAYGQGKLIAADGTVTGLDETITAATAYDRSGERLDNLIEIDADIVSGDSGGPLLDDEGEVIGVNTAASDTSTIPATYSQNLDITAYAIPIDDAMSIVDTILDGEETDTVTIGYPAFLGVQLAPSTMARSGMYGSPGLGALIGGVIEGTPAAGSGLRPGDTVIAVDGGQITSGEDLSQTLDGYEPGDVVTLTWADTAGQTHTADVTLTEGPAD